jgi:hypothetical protein
VVKYLSVRSVDFVEHLSFKYFISFNLCSLWCDPSRYSASHLEASSCWILSALVVAIEKQYNSYWGMLGLM